jgi:putative transposase
MSIRRELIDELLKEYQTPQDVLGEDGLLKQLTKAVIERCLETALDTHLGYSKHGCKGNATGNAKKWTMPIHDWKPSLNRLAMEFADRFPRA